MGSLYGADVSHWQQSTPTNGLSFIFAKATEGANFIDPEYVQHASRALAAGLYLGAYHFARDDAGIEEQALFFVQHSAKAKALAVDNEGPHILTRAQTTALISAIKRLDPLHRKVLLYMSEKQPFFLNCGQDANWVANWGPTPPAIPWGIWQYTSSPYDKDRARDQATLDMIFGKTPSTGAPHYHAVTTQPTSLWNDDTHRWVYNGPNKRPIGTKLVVRGAKYTKGGQSCYPVVPGTVYGGYYVPVANVRLGSKV